MITPIFTAHCDGCAYWCDYLTGDTYREVAQRAKKAGWQVGRRRDEVFCDVCAAVPVVESTNQP